MIRSAREWPISRQALYDGTQTGMTLLPSCEVCYIRSFNLGYIIVYQYFGVQIGLILRHCKA